MRFADVFIREENLSKKVKISSESKPKITDDLIEKWQGILNATADIFNVPAGLIMRITEKNMEVFVKSTNKQNPYKNIDKDTLGHGLYCETVIGKDQPLHVENALNHDTWKDNPDIALNMIAYYGLPIKWHDDEVFGTICILDSKSNPFDEKHRKLLNLFKSSIEADLYNLMLINHLSQLAAFDSLTGIANRRYILIQLDNVFATYQRNKDPITIAILDITSFKAINDSYGHEVGDDVLKAFAKTIQKRLRGSDTIGRIGGDEFLLILNSTNASGAQTLLKTLKETVKTHKKLEKHNINFDFGIAELTEKTQSVKQLMRNADNALMKQKQKKT